MLSASVALELPPTSAPTAPLIPIDHSVSPEPAESVEALVQQQLQQSNYSSLRSIECKVSSGTARLSGQLPSFYLKQTAQEIVRRVTGIDQVRNLVEVVYR